VCVCVCVRVTLISYVDVNAMLSVQEPAEASRINSKLNSSISNREAFSSSSLSGTSPVGYYGHAVGKQTHTHIYIHTPTSLPPPPSASGDFDGDNRVDMAIGAYGTGERGDAQVGMVHVIYDNNTQYRINGVYTCTYMQSE